MKILVISDSHGNDDYVYQAMQNERDSKVIIHLGDGPNDMQYALYNVPNLEVEKVIAVRGNCDLMSDNPITTFENIGGHKFYITHGFMQRVKHGVEGLYLDAKKNDREVALFGHTHRQLYEKRDDIYLFNPGSIGRGEYGIIIIDESTGEMLFKHKEI